ncbi:hypothetical protein [Streptomyces sp. BE133]|uniref:hypothetical protein n=1 Tax=Streptomyces sp. BE133 TaxID=3002523 RepID=UPI002E798C55|nr:hypothetical protein [Streptomyces sp. BE133]MEE1808182.1 hypothetical protein [Streptomyces sp. BE133]
MTGSERARFYTEVLAADESVGLAVTHQWWKVAMLHRAPLPTRAGPMPQPTALSSPSTICSWTEFSELDRLDRGDPGTDGTRHARRSPREDRNFLRALAIVVGGAIDLGRQPPGDAMDDFEVRHSLEVPGEPVIIEYMVIRDAEEIRVPVLVWFH